MTPTRIRHAAAGDVLGLAGGVDLPGGRTVAAPRLVQHLETGSSGEGNSQTVDLPGGLTVGNFLLLIAWADSGLDTPAGWSTPNTSLGRAMIFYREVDGTEPDSVDLTGTDFSAMATVLEYAGVDLVHPFGVGGLTLNPDTGLPADFLEGDLTYSLTPPAPAYTVAEDGTLLIELLTTNHSSAEGDITAAPAGSTLRVNLYDPACNGSLAVADRQAKAGVVAAGHWTRTGAGPFVQVPVRFGLKAA